MKRQVQKVRPANGRFILQLFPSRAGDPVDAEHKTSLISPVRAQPPRPVIGRTGALGSLAVNLVWVLEAKKYLLSNRFPDFDDHQPE